MNHDRVRHDRAQAVIQYPDTDQLDVRLFDLFCDVLRVPDGSAVVALATCPAVSEHQHDSAGFGPWRE